jgi:hypothetical protein
MVKRGAGQTSTGYDDLPMTLAVTPMRIRAPPPLATERLPRGGSLEGE